jgi:phosphatidylglycerol:prolipoprotein diacylglycerol transferase
LFPVLLDLKIGGRDIALHSYGVLIAVGLAAAIAFAYRDGRRDGLDGGRILDLAFWMVVAGLVGARLLYVVVNAGDFARACTEGNGEARSWTTALADCARVLKVWEGGLVFYGGVVAAVIVAYRFAAREGWSFLHVADLFAPALALGHAFGRLGCFAAGCCFGKESTGHWGVAFPRGSVAFDELSAAGAVPAGAGVTPPLHATQLYEAVGELAIFCVLMAARRRLRGRRGAVFLLYVALYAPLRFVIEMFRGDVARRFAFELQTPRLAAWLHLPAQEPLFLSVGQLSSIVVLAALAIIWGYRSRQHRGPAPRMPAL